jgi:hypothetical protein
MATLVLQAPLGRRATPVTLVLPGLLGLQVPPARPDPRVLLVRQA